jgi:hypothetical protein
VIKLEIKNSPANTGSKGAESVDNPTTRFVTGYLNAKTVSTTQVRNATIQADRGV